MNADRIVEPTQLDLFADGRDAFLIHDVVTRLVAREHEGAVACLARLQEEHPSHPDLPALSRLVESLLTAPAPASHAAVTASIETMDRDLIPAARRFLGTDAGAFLRPLWETLATIAVNLPFDDRHPQAHAGWVRQQYDDWAGVRMAIEAERDWATKPVLRCWMGLARHHLGEPEIAIRLWLPLCWTDPALFARSAPALPSAVVREGWNAFERAGAFDEFMDDMVHTATWFPAWLLLRHRGLARLFRPDDVLDAGTAARAFVALLALLPMEGQGLGDELIARRRALRRLSPGFFRCYMDAVTGPSRPVRVKA